MGLGATGMHEWGRVWCVDDVCECHVCAGDRGNNFNIVDIFNVKTGAWSTAVLSQPRWSLAATSLPNAGVAIFAGGGLGT
jgi:hypothetical protein